jgi:MFS family permease
LVVGLGTVVFPLHFRSLGFSVSYAGFLVGLASAGGAVVSLLCGWAIERADRRRALLAGTVLVAAAYLLYTVTFSRGGLTGLRLAHGLVMPLMSVPAMVLISDVGGARRGRVAGMVNQWGAYGLIAGPVAGGALLEFAGAGSVFALSAAALVLGALIVFFAVPARVPGRAPDRAGAPATAGAAGASAAPTGRALARNPRVLLLVGVNLLDFVAFQAWAFLLAVTLQARGAPESVIGTMMTVNCLAYAVVQGVCGRLADAGRGMHAVAVGTFACGVAAILIPVAPLPFALGAVMLFLGAGSGPTFTGVYAGLSAEAGKAMPRAMGMLQASTGLGSALGPLLAGALGGLSMTAGFGAVLAALWLETALAGAYLAARRRHAGRATEHRCSSHRLRQPHSQAQ